jgi:HSP20 family protein
MDRIRSRENRSMMPFDAARQLTEDGWWEARPWMTRDDFLATDMYETEEGLVIEVVLPGIEPDDIEIRASGDTLTLQGEIKGPDPEKVNYLAQERSYGRFRRTIQLPQIMSSEIDATMEKGILRMLLAKPEGERLRKIQVKEVK